MPMSEIVAKQTAQHVLFALKSTSRLRPAYQRKLTYSVALQYVSENVPSDLMATVVSTLTYEQIVEAYLRTYPHLEVTPSERSQ